MQNGSLTTGLSVSSCPGMSTSRKEPSAMPCRALTGLHSTRRSTTSLEPSVDHTTYLNHKEYNNININVNINKYK